MNTQHTVLECGQSENGPRITVLPPPDKLSLAQARQVNHWCDLESAVDLSRILVEDYERNFPLLYQAIGMTLLRRTFEALHDPDHASPTMVKVWQSLLLAHLRCDLEDLPGFSGLSDEQRQERIWDIFAVPEPERARRRAANKKPKPEAEAAA